MKPIRKGKEIKLSQYILHHQTNSALQLFHDLSIQNEEPIKLIAILVGQFRLLIQVKYLMKQGYQQGNIADMLKIHTYRVKLAMQEVRKYQMHDLLHLFDQLVELDYQIKSGQVEKNFAFQIVGGIVARVAGQTFVDTGESFFQLVLSDKLVYLFCRYHVFSLFEA